MFDWHHSRDMAGYGALGDLGTHAIDLARFLIGEIVSVQAISKTFISQRPINGRPENHRRVDVDDVTLAVISFSNGVIGTIEASWLTPGRTDSLGFEIYGSRGSLIFDSERLDELIVYLEGNKYIIGPQKVLVLRDVHPYMKNYWSNQAGGFRWEDTFTNELHHFVECLTQERTIDPEGATFLDGFRNCKVMDAIIRSSMEEKKIDVN